MRFEQLSFVAEVARCGSMNLAAESLHVSQQNISKSIRQLERELGITAFVRTNKGVTLTPEGQRLYDFIREQEDRMNALRARIRQEQRQLMEGELTLATMNTGANMILPQMICAFYRHYPRVHLNIRDGMVEDVLEQILSGQAQVGIITWARLGARTYPHLAPEVKFVPLMPGRSVYWVSKLSPLAGKRQLSFAEVAAQPVLYYEQMDLAFLRETYRFFGCEPRVALQSKNLYLLGRLTAENHGLLPDMRLATDESMYQYVFQNQPAAAAIPLQDYPDYEVAVGYIMRRDVQPSPLLAHLLQFMERMGDGGRAWACD